MLLKRHSCQARQGEEEAASKQNQKRAKNDGRDGKFDKSAGSSDSNINNLHTETEGSELITQEPKASLVLFYQYVDPTWSQEKVSSFLSYLTSIAKRHRTNVGGRIRVSTEGVNATVSAASTSDPHRGTKGGEVDVVDPTFEAARTLRHFAEDLRRFDPDAFSDTDFKFVDGLSADRHFKELKLLPVKELVFYGIRDEDCAVGVAGNGGGAKEGVEGKEVVGGRGGGLHLEAREYHEMLKRDNTVVIDVRNHYEAAIGRFDGQMAAGGSAGNEDAGKSEEGGAAAAAAAAARDKKDNSGNASGGGGAEYIDPKMRKSTDFTSWLAEPDTKSKLEGKTVMMFCTGECTHTILQSRAHDDAHTFQRHIFIMVRVLQKVTQFLCSHTLTQGG